jgi:hypothetical protein
MSSGNFAIPELTSFVWRAVEDIRRNTVPSGPGRADPEPIPLPSFHPEMPPRLLCELASLHALLLDESDLPLEDGARALASTQIWHGVRRCRGHRDKGERLVLL